MGAHHTQSATTATAMTTTTTMTTLGTQDRESSILNRTLALYLYVRMESTVYDDALAGERSNG